MCFRADLSSAEKSEGCTDFVLLGEDDDMKID